jgi:Bacterial Ig-like domain (group 3)
MLKRAALPFVLLYTTCLFFSSTRAFSETAGEQPATGLVTHTRVEIILSEDSVSRTAVAIVSGPDRVPTGTVSFRLGNVEIGRVPLNSSGRATINVPANSDAASLHAIYSGDTIHLTSDTAVSEMSNPPVPALTASPSQVDFGGQGIGTTSSPAQQITLTNTGTDPLSLSSIALVGANASDYIISGNKCKFSPATLAPAASCTFGVSFHPSTPGPSNASASISSDDPDRLLFP